MRRARFGSGLLLLLSSLPLRAAGPEPPALELKERTLAVSALPPVLARPEVRPHLSTGLTTTFAVEVSVLDAQGHRARGGGRIDVRYELWDEVFLVSATGADGRTHRESLPSFDRLLAWWRGLVLPVLAADPLSASGPWRTEVRLSVVPFSQSEQRDTQRWLSESIERRERGDAASPVGRPEPLTGTLDALIATSIQRHRLVSYDWQVVFQPERRR